MRNPKINDVVLLNSLELGFARGTYVTGIVIAIKTKPNCDTVRSVTVRYRKGGKNCEVTKTIFNIRLLEYDQIEDLYGKQ